ncbi:MAG: putative kinase [Rhizobacter sp.]|nr:putative kinase [Rhizobacter sp.]
MLIVLGGLPGVGKTSIARELVARLRCVYLRIDVIEQALVSLRESKDVGPAGYVIAYELAKSNLAFGLTVIADCVNPLSVTRSAWRSVAMGASSRLLEVEVVCSDLTEHRRRIEGRQADIQGWVLPTWESVVHHEYETWTTNRLVVDSALMSASEAANLISDSCRTS